MNTVGGSTNLVRGGLPIVTATLSDGSCDHVGLPCPDLALPDPMTAVVCQDRGARPPGGDKSAGRAEPQRETP